MKNADNKKIPVRAIKIFKVNGKQTDAYTIFLRIDRIIQDYLRLSLMMPEDEVKNDRTRQQGRCYRNRK